MTLRAEADLDACPPLRRAGGLRIATAPLAAGAEPPSPQQVLKRLVAICRGDVADTVPAAAAAACRLSAGMSGVSPAQASLWRELAAAKPASAEAIAPGAVWMMRRGDGSFIGTCRLGEGGRVGLYPHPNESRWRLDNGVLRLQTPQGETTTEFRLALSTNGRLCFVGLFCDGSTLHVLSQIDCEFGRLVMADPELAGCHDFTVEPKSSSAWDAGIQPAVLLAAARTGSHLLLNLLNSTGRVFFDAEIMNFGKISVFGHDLPIERSAHLNRLRADDPADFARVMLSRSYHLDGRRLDDVRVRGFKLFPEQHPALARWAIADPSIRIVHLFRGNLLAEYASLLTAMENGHWVGGAQSVKTPQRIDFDAPRFLRFVAAKTAHWSRLREQCARREGGFVEIEYAGIDRAGIGRVLRYLGVEDDGAEMSSLGLPRQGAERVIDRFAQPDAVMRCLEAMGQEQWAGIERAAVARL